MTAEPGLVETLAPAPSRNGSSPSPVPDAEPAVRLRAVSKVFGEASRAVVALDGVDLEVARGSFVCLVGASGCGKTTLLNLVAGLDKPSAGEVHTFGHRTGLMFQESALFPWMTVAGNVDAALKFRKVPKAQRKARVAELLDLVHLGSFADHRPHQLSGGMRQRVALARALAQDADVLAMDEPFGALDAMTRDLLHDELERIWAATGVTILFVTHDVREAVRLADSVVVLTSRPGRVAERIDVDIARPRRIDDPAVAALTTTITDRLRAEVRRHAHD